MNWVISSEISVNFPHSTKSRRGQIYIFVIRLRYSFKQAIHQSIRLGESKQCFSYTSEHVGTGWIEPLERLSEQAESPVSDSTFKIDCLVCFTIWPAMSSTADALPPAPRSVLPSLFKVGKLLLTSSFNSKRAISPPREVNFNWLILRELGGIFTSLISFLPSGEFWFTWMTLFYKNFCSLHNSIFRSRIYIINLMQNTR